MKRPKREIRETIRYIWRRVCSAYELDRQWWCCCCRRLLAILLLLLLFFNRLTEHILMRNMKSYLYGSQVTVRLPIWLCMCGKFCCFQTATDLCCFFFPSLIRLAGYTIYLCINLGMTIKSTDEFFLWLMCRSFQMNLFSISKLSDYSLNIRFGWGDIRRFFI